MYNGNLSISKDGGISVCVYGGQTNLSDGNGHVGAIDVSVFFQEYVDAHPELEFIF